MMSVLTDIDLENRSQQAFQEFFHIGVVTVLMMDTRNIPIGLPNVALSAPPTPTANDRWALFLDVDGTLLEFNDDPQAVHVSETLLTLLHSLYHALDGALALVSGRDLDDLNRLFDRPQWAAAGLHGLQLRRATAASAGSR